MASAIVSILMVTLAWRAVVAPETYTSATVDARGRLVIHTSADRSIVVDKQGEQTTFADPVISADGTAVGAQAEFPNCCTSYDIPLQLVVYSRGKVHRFTGSGLPIFRWQFANSGERVAFGQEPVHFGCVIHYELRDVASERLLDSADVPEPCGQDPNPDMNVRIPDWVAKLLNKRPFAQFAERILQLGLRVHHDRAVPRDGLFDGPA